MKPDPGDLGTTVLAILGKQVLLLITCLFFIYEIVWWVSFTWTSSSSCLSSSRSTWHSRPSVIWQSQTHIQFI